MSVGYRYQTFWPRFWAGFVDGLVFLPMTLPDIYLSSPARSSLVLILWALISYPAYWIYEVTLHAYRGQTVGKRSQKVKVMDLSELRIPSWRQALLREIGTVVPSTCGLVYFIYLVLAKKYTMAASLENYWPLAALGFLNVGWFVLEITTMLANQKRRALHDLIAGTVVIRVE